MITIEKIEPVQFKRGIKYTYMDWYYPMEICCRIEVAHALAAFYRKLDHNARVVKYITMKGLDTEERFIVMVTTANMGWA